MPKDERGRRIALTGECGICGRRGNHVFEDDSGRGSQDKGKAGSFLFSSSPMMCGFCLAVMRELFGITEKDLADARERGFYRPAYVGEQLDKALKHLDQAEQVTPASRPRAPRAFAT